MKAAVLEHELHFHSAQRCLDNAAFEVALHLEAFRRRAVQLKGGYHRSGRLPSKALRKPQTIVINSLEFHERGSLIEIGVERPADAARHLNHQVGLSIIRIRLKDDPPPAMVFGYQRRKDLPVDPQLVNAPHAVKRCGSGRLLKLPHLSVSIGKFASSQVATIRELKDESSVV